MCFNARRIFASVDSLFKGLKAWHFVLAHYGLPFLAATLPAVAARR
jgi:hypothetical protein